MRRTMWFSIGFGGACALGAYLFPSGSWPVAVVAGALCLLSFLLRKKYIMFRISAGVLLGITVGTCWFSGYERLYLAPSRTVDEQILPISATATDHSYRTDYGSAVEGRLWVDGKEYPALLYLDGEVTLSPGDMIFGNFRLRSTMVAKTYHRGNGILLLAYPKSETVYQEAQSLPLRYRPAMIRRSLTDTIERVFPEDTAFFAKALLLGDRSDVDHQTNTAFKVSGISHIIAVSGLHVSILFSLVYLFCGKRRIGTALIGIPVLFLFAAVVGFTPSVTRACLMQCLMILALLVDREYDPPTALGFAALVMLLADPTVVMSVSFQLSVGCMAGIFLFSGRIGRWVEGLPFWRDWKGDTLSVRIRRWISGGISITVSAMFFTTPLVAYYFGAVSLVGIVTNLLTLWVVTAVFYGIMAVCLVSFLWEWAGVGLAWLVSWPVRYVLSVADLLSSFPLAAVYTQSVYIVLWLVLCYGLVLLFLWGKERQPHVLISCGVLGLCVALGLSWAEPLMDDFRVTVLDVGQGQCILLQADGKSYLVDCGGDSDTGSGDLAAETLLSQGIAHLDGLIVTHYDRDHAGGVAYLLSRVPADTVFLPDTKDHDEMLGQILCHCSDTHIVVQEDITICWADDSLTVLAPVTSYSSNESGLSVLFRGADHDILITGDMGGLGETLLLRHGPLPELTVLVAGHHGSRTSTGEALLATTKPQYVFISVGEDNGYGHPSDEVLERLERYGCIVYRTDECGTIIFRR